MPRAANSSRQTQAVLQALLASMPRWRHGYHLSQETQLKSGTLYPILLRLQRQGWLDEQWEEEIAPGRPRRHLYRLTAPGAAEAARRQPVGRRDHGAAFLPAAEGEIE